jgi:glycosyltransferase involved in cell wall biosynthesis
LRIALVSTDYPPLKTSAAVQMRDLAREFARQGHEPVVIIPASGAAEPWTLETEDGVSVLRLAAAETRTASHASRALAEFFLPFVMLRKLRRSSLAGAGWDYIVWYSPPIFFAPLIWALRRGSGGYTYLILRDMFPEWALDLGLLRKGPTYYALKLAAATQYAIADTIGVQTPSNLGYMAKWEKLQRRRIEVLSNWLADEPVGACRIKVDQTQLAGRTVLCYIGNMGVAQSMDILLELAQSLHHRRDIGFLFVGRGSEFARLVAEATARALDNILFHDEIPPDEIPGLLAQCDVGLVALDPRHKSHNIPGKFVSYMRYGLPVLARLNEGTDLAGLIEGDDVGRVYTGNEVDRLRQLAEELVDSAELRRAMSQRAFALNQRMFLPSAAVRQIISARVRAGDAPTAPARVS